MKISESFYSVQCEGISTGIPSYFIRLTRCNLSCGFSREAIATLTYDMETNPDKSGTSDVDKKYADLFRNNKASWFCDSAAVWVKGIDVTNEELEQRINDVGILTPVLKGRTHLIWTGGEPTLMHHQNNIMSFLDYLNNKYTDASIFSEIETNGSLQTQGAFYEQNPDRCTAALYSYIQQINCSPKLANSGMERALRINPRAIAQIMAHPNYQFKFVISTEDDIHEIKEEWIAPFNIPYDRIVLMPGVDDPKDMQERTAFLFDMVKKYGYRGITRTHILAWGKVTGV